VPISDDVSKRPEAPAKTTARKSLFSRPWTKGLGTLGGVVGFVVAAGTFLMAISLFVNKPDASKEVLPFATGLIGFLGGLVLAMYGGTTSPESPTKPDRVP
jgi:hypothetical protein